MRPDEVTSEMVSTYITTLQGSPGGIREGLAAVLSMPEVRQAIYFEVRSESDAKLKAMGVTGYSLEWDR